MSVDGKAFKDCTHKEALHALRLTKDKVKIIIDRKNDTSNLYQDLEVELNKKPGKGLGLSVVGRRDGNGVFISDMVSFYCYIFLKNDYFSISTQFFYSYMYFLKPLIVVIPVKNQKLRFWRKNIFQNICFN